MGFSALSGHGFNSFGLKVGSLRLIDTTASSVLLEVYANITNPTNYSATVPFVDIQILVNNTVVGNATTQSIYIEPGRNINIPVLARWNPLRSGSEKGAVIGKNFISQYISGVLKLFIFQDSYSSTARI